MFDIYADVIIGWHEYKRNGAVVESILAYVNTPYVIGSGHSTILGGSDIGSGILSCQFADLSKKKFGHLMLELTSNQTQFEWSLTNNEGIRIGTYDWRFTLPTLLTLTKQ
jgi:hypothetical protein